MTAHQVQDSHAGVVARSIDTTASLPIELLLASITEDCHG